MAYKIVQDIEKPLRTPPTDDYNRLQQVYIPNPLCISQENINCLPQMEPIIQSIENKGKLKGSIFRKSKNKSADWKTEGAEYLDLHQKIDQARLERLKSMVEKFSRIQSEQLMKRVEVWPETWFYLASLLITSYRWQISHCPVLKHSIL